MSRPSFSIRRTLLATLVLLWTMWAPGYALEADGTKDHERLIHLPGIAGARPLDRHFVAGLHDGGYEGKSEIYDWTAGDPGIAALLARRRNERQADRIAARIERLLSDDPQLKIRLVCHSGGAGIAAWALERLPEGVQVETLVLVAPALSQQYDLSKALTHVRGKAYAFTSPNDTIILGAGTRLFGTIDGVKEEASGLVGFTKPGEADDTQYAKLVSMPYTAEWMDLGNTGDHIGPMGRTFAREVMSPILQGFEPRPATQPAAEERDGAAEADPAAPVDAVGEESTAPIPVGR